MIDVTPIKYVYDVVVTNLYNYASKLDWDDTTELYNEILDFATKDQIFQGEEDTVIVWASCLLMVSPTREYQPIYNDEMYPNSKAETIIKWAQEAVAHDVYNQVINNYNANMEFNI